MTACVCMPEKDGHSIECPKAPPTMHKLCTFCLEDLASEIEAEVIKVGDMIAVVSDSDCANGESGDAAPRG